mgnify:CR=1 FL=1
MEIDICPFCGCTGTPSVSVVRMTSNRIKALQEELSRRCFCALSFGECEGLHSSHEKKLSDFLRTNFPKIKNGNFQEIYSLPQGDVLRIEFVARYKYLQRLRDRLRHLRKNNEYHERTEVEKRGVSAWLE